MANPGLSPEEMKRRKRVLYECLEAGFTPPGIRYKGAKPAIIEAARRLGFPSNTLRSWLAAEASDGEALDWGRWKDLREVKEPEPVSAKPIVRMRAAKPAGKPIRVVVPGDMHDDPSLPSDRFEWIGKYVAQSKPDFFVDIGDSISFESLCGHIPNETFHGRLKGTYEQDLRSADEAYTRLYQHFPEHTKRLKCRGNHEHRLFLYEDQNPEVMGMMQGEYRRLLEKHEITEAPFGEWVFIGAVGFVHVPLNKMGKPYGGKNPCNQIVNDATFDIVFGHTHNKHSTQTPKLGPQNHVSVHNVGCALPWGFVEEYAKLSNAGWWWGIHEFEIQGGQIQSAREITMQQLEREFG